MSADVPLLDLPDDPDLAVVARALELHGFAGEVWDASWRVAYLSSEHRTLVSAGRRRADVAGLGAHLLSAESIAARETWPTGPTFESFRESLRDWGSFVMSTTPGGRDALLEIAEPRLEEVLQSIVSKPPPPAWSTRLDVRFGDETIGNDVLVIALRGAHGQRGGYVAIVKPELRAGVLGMLALGDARLFERMSVLLEPARRPGAVLFADLEASTEAKTAPTPTSASTPTIARTTIMT